VCDLYKASGKLGGRLVGNGGGCEPCSTGYGFVDDGAEKLIYTFKSNAGVGRSSNLAIY
jgi:hypothetical protein